MSIRARVKLGLEKYLKKLAVVSASTTFAIAGPCGITSSSVLEEESSEYESNSQEEAKVSVEEYNFSVGVHVPYSRIEAETLTEQIREKILDLGIDTIVDYVSASSIVGIVREVIEEMPSVGNSASFDWYVMSDDNNEWSKSTTIDAGEDFSILLKYDQGDEMPHAEGLFAYIIDKGLNKRVMSRTLLMPKEEGGLPPRIFILKKPLSLEEYLNYGSSVPQSFRIGNEDNRGSPANVTVRFNNSDDGNGGNNEDSDSGGDSGDSGGSTNYDIEPNNTFSEAVSLPLNHSITVKGNVVNNPSCGYDCDTADTYRFYAQAGDSVKLNIKRLSGDCLCVYLHDSDFNVLHLGEDSDSYCSWPDSPSQYNSPTVKLKVTGDHYLSLVTCEGQPYNYQFIVTKTD